MVSFTASPSASSISAADVGVVGEHVLGQAQVHGQGHEVLLGAVVEVALDLAALGVAGGHDAGARGAEVLVGLLEVLEALLQGRVELHVVQGQADLAGQLGEHAVVLLGELVAVGRPLDHEQAEQLARVRGGGDPELGVGRGPRAAPGSHTSSQALPVTPARVTTGCSSAPSTSGGAVAVGHRRRPARAGPACPVQISARRSTSTLRSDSASCSSSSSIGMARLSRLPQVRSTSSGGWRSP